MKRNILCGLSAVAGIFLLSCKNAPEYENVVYVTGTEASNSMTIYVDGTAETGFSVTLADLVNHKVEVEVGVDEGLIEWYNTVYHKNCKALPTGSYALSDTKLTIEPQELRSNISKVEILTDANFEEGTPYLLPITIKRVSGGVKLLEASKTIFINVVKTIHTKCLNLGASRHLLVDFASKNDASLTALPGCTMETRFRINSLQGNPYINSIMGLEENFLIRIGNAGVIEKDQIQEAKSDCTAPERITLGEWYHVAAVFENGLVKLYLNGNMVAQNSHPKGGLMNLTDVYSEPSFSIGRSAGSRYFNGYISEMRVWKKALSRAEINNNMCYVDPTTPGLVAYWRFDGSTMGDDGVTILDHSGNGYHANCSGNIDASRWIDISCPD